MIAFHRQAKKKKGKTKKNSTGKRGKKAAKKSKGVKDRKKKSESESGASEESNKETEEQRRKREEKEAEDEKKKEESEKKKAEKAMEKAKEKEKKDAFRKDLRKGTQAGFVGPGICLLPFPQLSIWSRGPHVNYWSFALDPTSLRITPSGAQQDQCADFQSHISWWQASQYDPWPGFGLAGLAVRFGGDGPAGKGHDGEHWGIFILVFSTLCFDGSPGPHSNSMIIVSYNSITCIRYHFKFSITSWYIVS